MNDGDEIDYMSDEFLIAGESKNDIRPGMTYNYTTKRKYEIEKKRKIEIEKHRLKNKPINIISKERLEEGLNTAIQSDNKGFAMLKKMGYKPGTSLGKEGKSGLTEPVMVELKSDRIGFGWKERLKEIKMKKIEARKKNEIVDPYEFRLRMGSIQREKYIKRDLLKSQRTCYELDSKQDLQCPPEKWFWPKIVAQELENENNLDDEIVKRWNRDIDDNVKASENGDESDKEEEEDDDLFEDFEKLEILTSYLRTTYFYCIWCCVAYDDERDLAKSCPGRTRDDHD